MLSRIRDGDTRERTLALFAHGAELSAVQVAGRLGITHAAANRRLRRLQAAGALTRTWQVDEDGGSRSARLWFYALGPVR